MGRTGPGSRLFCLAMVALGPLCGVALGASTDFHSQGADPCAICHSLSSVKGWIDESAPSGTSNWASKAGSAKCYFCHQVGSPTGARDVYSTAMGQDGNLVHLYRVVDMPPNLDGTAGAVPAKWYQRDGELDCVTCHDVHSRSVRPYLGNAASIGELCDDCHKRGWSGAKGANNTTSFLRSTHPEGVAYAFSGSVGEPFPSVFVYRNLGTAADVTKNFGEALPSGATQLWNLGSHLSLGASGTIECQTCHAVHGGEDYPPVAGGGLAPEPGLLVAPLIGLAGGGTPDEFPKASICQACHRGGDPGETVQDATPGFGTPSRDHPTGLRLRAADLPINRQVDAADDDSSNKTGAGSGWSRYWGNNGASDEVVVCVTCHDVHGGLDRTPLWRRSDKIADDQTAQTRSNWCETCHADAAPRAHHSNKSNLASSLLVCADCHGSSYQAHGDFFTAFQAPAAPISRTIPGRGPVSVAVEAVRLNADSALCIYCHNPSDPTDFVLASAPVSGTLLTAEATMPARHGVDRGSATHFGGADTDEMFDSEFRVDPWPGTGGQYYSKYGGATGGGLEPPAGIVKGTSTLICESCHNVRYNDGAANTSRYGSQGAKEGGWRSNLLLELYRDDYSGTGDGTDHTRSDQRDGDGTGSQLCLGCHYAAGLTPGEHHPLTGETVSATGAVLNTDGTPAPSRADQPGAPGTLSYPAVDRLDCDSCHRPHDADDDSAFAAGIFGKNRQAHYVLEVAGPSNTTVLCDVCHAR